MKKKSHIKKRYTFMLTFILIIVGTLLWARYISTSGLIIKEYKVVNSQLPTSFDGLKIVQFSDVHYGRTINDKELTHLVNEVNALKPDLIFFTGDLIDKDTKITSVIENKIIAKLKLMKATYGKYAVSGNHDTYFKDYAKIIKESDFIDLDSAYDIIYGSDYKSIFIAGLESGVRGKPQISNITNYLDSTKNNKAQANNTPSYKILLLHTPDTFDKVKDYNFDLVLAGHSHNGQVRLPFIGVITTPVGAKNYYDPYYKIGKTDFYISGGLGTSHFNFRFFDKPSFNFYRLVIK